MNSFRLFSYVVEHDTGFAPNPGHNYCTLAHCKYQHSNRRRNLVEMAREGNWVAGTGGANHAKSAGHRKLIFLMLVTEKLSLKDYWNDRRFRKKQPRRHQRFPGDNVKTKIKAGRFVLISDKYWYFGRNALDLPPGIARKIEKRGPGYRSCSIKSETVQALINLVKKYSPKSGVLGDPCHESENFKSPRCGRCH